MPLKTGILPVMTKRVRASLSLALLTGIVGLASVAHADDASKRAKVQELLSVMKIEGLTTQVMGSVSQQTQALAQHQFGASPTPDQQKQLTDFQGKVSTLVSDAVGWKAMEPDFVKLYSDTYTEPEIDGILGFYKSPVGQSMLAKAPELAQKSQGIVQQRMVAIQPQLRQLVQDFIKQTTPAASGSGASSPAPSSQPPPSLNATPKK